MIAVCYKENIAYTCKTRLEVEMELIQTQGLPGFGVWLFEQGHRPFKVLQVQGRKALVALRGHSKWVSI